MAKIGEDERVQRRERAILDHVVDTSPVGIVIVDHDGLITYANPHAERILGLTRDEITLRTYNAPSWHITDYEGNRLSDDELPFERVMSTRQSVYGVQHAIQWPNGERKHLMINGAPLLSDSGAVDCVVFSIEDITERKRAEEERQTNFDRLRKSEQKLRESEEKLRLKLDSVLSPDIDILDLDLSNILGAPQIQSLMEDFTRLTGVATAILDVKGKVVEATAWQDICTKFHRVNEETARFCTESDLYLAKNLRPGEYVAYKCRNNLWDVVTPLFIAEKHVGNVYIGQFLYDDEVVDEALFAAQADRYGFDKEEYLAALRCVPRFSRRRVTELMDYLVKFSEFMSRLSYSNLKLARATVEQNRVEDALRESEEKYRRTVELASEGIWVGDAEGRVVFANPRMASMLGFEPEDVAGKEVLSFVAVRDRRTAADNMELVRRGARIEHVYDLVTRAGRLLPASVSAAPITDRDGAFHGFVGVTYDLSKMKEIEKALIDERDRARDYLDTVRAIVVVLDRNGVVTLINRRGCEVLKAREDEVVGKNWFETFLPETLRKEVHGVFQGLMDGKIEEVENFVNPVVTSTGEIRTISWHNALLNDDAGVVTSTLSAGEDITDRLQTEKQLRASEERYRRLVQNAPDVIFRIRHMPAAKLEFISPACETVLGYTPEEMYKSPELMIYAAHPDDRHLVTGLWHSPEGASGSDAIHVRFLHKSGALVWCEIRYTHVLDDEGRFEASEGILRDVTERIMVEEELLRRKEAAEAATLKAQTYLDFIAHDLTNILSPVMMHAELISTDPRSHPWVKESASKIVRQIEQATSFARNTRRLSESDRDERKRAESVDLRTVVEEAEEYVKMKYPGRRFDFAHDFPSEGSLSVMGKDYVRDIVEEILDNSSRHGLSDDIHVDIKANILQGPAGHGYVRMEIADRGPGIPDRLKKGLMAEAFEPESRFTRGIASSLSFMSLIAEHIGGRLRIEDRVLGDHSKGAKVILLLRTAG